MHKRSFTLGGHRTSIALEPEFWSELEALAERRQLSLSALLTEIDTTRDVDNLASACRLCVLAELKTGPRTTEG